jgi:sugar phosphate isomerase/epimerase
MRWALAVEGGSGGFPRSAEVRQWLEALDLRAWVPGRSFTPPDPRQVAAELSGVTTVAVRHVFSAPVAAESELLGAALGDEALARRERAVDQLVATAAWATAARASWVVVELAVGGVATIPGSEPDRAARDRDRDRLLDRVCRSLHAVGPAAPAVGIALVPSRRSTLLDTPGAFERIFEDLGARRRLAYWHDAGTCHALEREGHGPASAWLDAHASRCIAVDATDAIGTSAGLPAGAGEVDFPTVLGALSANTWGVIRSEPFVGAGPLLAAARHLRREPR